MNCAELKELAPLYAAGALDAQERAAVEAHLAEAGPHQGCQEAMAEAQLTAAALARSLPPVRPDERVWAGIAAKLEGGAPRARRQLPGWLPWAIAAAAGLAAVVFGLDRNRLAGERDRSNRALTEAQAKLDRNQGDVARAEAAAQLEHARCNELVGQARELRVLEQQALALLERPGTKVVPLGPAGAHSNRASAIVNAELHRAYVLATALAPQAGKDYELWVIHGKAAPEPAGFLKELGSGVTVGEIDARLLAATPDALAVSLEPAGGRPTPTDVLMVGRI